MCKFYTDNIAYKLYLYTFISKKFYTTILPTNDLLIFQI